MDFENLPEGNTESFLTFSVSLIGFLESLDPFESKGWAPSDVNSEVTIQCLSRRDDWIDTSFSK